jgi:vancomycin resistance protein YoaR
MSKVKINMNLSGISKLFRQAFMAIILGGFLFAFAIGLAVFGIQITHAGRIFPGVQIGQVDLGGKPVNQALLALADAATIPLNANLQLQFHSNTWQATPAQLGLSLDPGSTLLNAYAVGRSGPIDRWVADFIGVLTGKHPISLIQIFNQNVAYQFLENVSRQINQPVREAELKVQGSHIIAEPGKIGYSLDIPASIELISNAILNQQDSIIPLIVKETQPELLDASEFAKAAQSILSSPLILTTAYDGASINKSWKFSPDELASMLLFNRVKSNGKIIFEVKINESILNNILTSIAETINRPAQNPHFIFNDETHQLEIIQPGVAGWTLNKTKSLAAIQSKLQNGVHTIPLEFDTVEPTVKNEASGDQLGIRELIHTEISYFYGSSKERVQNIQTASGRFHGLLVAPGESFSMAKALGDVSLDNGYAEALIIFNGQTIQGVGGGVCQVSTALFRAAFFSGFPITERHQHAYRVKYYEKENGNRINSRLAGLDATVYVPIVDLKFTNDTPYWLLMETYVSPQNSTLTWKFYSTQNGRKVQMNTSGPTNLVEPPKPVYRENPSLKQGEIKQVDWEAQGADVQVIRMVLNLDNSIHLQDSFNTHYEPWRAIYEYGPGTEGIPQSETP